MGILNFSPANCKNCYKCLRACPVKAIRFKDNQAEIVEELCIGCGTCFTVCPQNARNVVSHLPILKEAIRRGEYVAAAVAPSTAAYTNMKGLRNALIKRGFSEVFEVAIGAEVVASLYNNYIRDNRPTNVILTSCPTIDLLIEKYYPSLLKYMVPVVSPMIAAGKIIKKNFKGAHVAFIGPCPAKKVEAFDAQTEDAVDSVLTYEELEEFLDEEGIKINNEASEGEGLIRGRNFPYTGGIIDFSIDKDLKKDYELISIDGVKRCMELFDTLEKGNLSNVIIEASACNGSCIGGPCMPKDIGIYERKRRVKEYIKASNKHIELDDSGLIFTKFYLNKSKKRDDIGDNELTKILHDMGKFTKEDELNCGVCGYDTCREKARAIYCGMAESSMCLHYMRNRAESVSNIIFDHSPNGIILLDRDLIIKEFNPSAEVIFKIPRESARDNHISSILNPDVFYKVIETGEDVTGHSIYLEEYDAYVVLSIINIERERLVLAIFTDISEEEKNKEQLKRVREKTLASAQDVIDRQMRVAQEIAGLLGETTAETKVILTKLKKLAEED